MRGPGGPQLESREVVKRPSSMLYTSATHGKFQTVLVWYKVQKLGRRECNRVAQSNLKEVMNYELLNISESGPAWRESVVVGKFYMAMIL